MQLSLVASYYEITRDSHPVTSVSAAQSVFSAGHSPTVAKRAGWLAHNANREREIADLEQLWHADQPRPGYRPGYGYVGEPSQWGQFVSHPDGTVEEGR